MVEIILNDTGECLDAQPIRWQGSDLLAGWYDAATDTTLSAQQAERILTPQEVAARLSACSERSAAISPFRVYHWLHAGHLPGIQVPGGGHGHGWRIRESALVGFKLPKRGRSKVR